MRLSLHRYLYDSGRALVLDGIQGLTDADLAQLADLNNEQRRTIRVVVLSHTRFTDEGLRHLAVLPNLAGLYLHGTCMTDDAPFELLPTSVEILNLDDTRVGDCSVAKLSRLPRLRTLRLRHTDVTDCGAFELLRAHRLRSLCLAETAVSDLAKRRLDNHFFLKAIGLSVALRLVRHYADRILRVLTLQNRPPRLKCR